MKFRKKPIEIEAIRFTGVNYDEIRAFVTRPGFSFNSLLQRVFIPTPEGEMRAESGDWIIKGVKGEFYPCKPDIFGDTYEPVEEGA